MKKSKLALLLILSAAVLGLSACGESETTNDAPPVVEQEQPALDHDPGEIDWSRYPIIINGERGVAADWHTAPGEDFPTHIPLMPVAEALGVQVNVDDSTVTMEGINGTITFTVGSFDFDVAGNTVELGHSSLLVGNNIYVPITFFRAVYGMGQSAWIGGHVFIDEQASDMY